MSNHDRGVFGMPRKVASSVVRAVADMLPPNQRRLAPYMADVMTAAIVHLCKTEGKARLPGLGVFVLKQRPERMARNPRNGQRVRAAAKEVLRFRAARHALAREQAAG